MICELFVEVFGLLFVCYCCFVIEVMVMLGVCGGFLCARPFKVFQSV